MPNNFKTALLHYNQIWGLTTTGKIKVFDSTGVSLNTSIPQNEQIFLIAQNKQGFVVAADSSSYIRDFDDKTASWNNITKFNGNLYGLVFDSRNQLCLLTNKGIIINNHKFAPDTTFSLNEEVHYDPDNMGAPSTYFIDKYDNIWLGYDHGEWGGDILLFNTTHQKFVKPDVSDKNIEIMPVRSFSQSGNDVYVSMGLQHFETYGNIIRFTNLKATLIFDSPSTSPKKGENLKIIPGEYIGPATINRYDSCLYFYSQNGIFKGNPKLDLSTINKWTKVLAPQLHWTSGQAKAVGSPMNVLSIQSIDKKKLFFVTVNDGIGLYDGKNLTMLQ